MILQLKDISKTFNTDVVLSNISMKVEAGERVAIVGVNGAGKSTLLKIIAQDLAHDEGEIFISKSTKMGYLRQNSGLNLENNIWDEIRLVFTELLALEEKLHEMEAKMGDPAIMDDAEAYEKLMTVYSASSDRFMSEGGYEMETKIRGILHGMGFDDIPKDTIIGNLSGGQRTRLALAKILLQEPDLLMLDEPTNHLDFITLAWLENYLKSYPGTVIVVSHDRYFLDALVNIVYEVERSHATRYVGNYSKYVEQKEIDRELYEKKYEMQQEQMKQMADYVQRNIASASSSKSAKNKRKQLERIDVLEKPVQDLKRTQMAFKKATSSHKDVLEVKDVCISIPDEDGTNRPLLQNINFNMFRDEKIAIIGPNGIGKSTLFKTILGEFAHQSGTIRWGDGVTIGYYDQEQANLNSNKTIIDEVWDDFPQIEEAHVRAVLGNFLFTGDDVFKTINSLSGGEKARVALSKLMLKKTNVMVIDEPTNHLDLYSKSILEDAFANFDGTLIFISHDRYFVNKLAEKMLELTPTGAKFYNGNFDDYTAAKMESEKDLLTAQ